MTRVKHHLPGSGKRNVKRAPRGSMHKVSANRIAAEYDAPVDGKHRVTIRNTKANYFRVFEAKDGTVVLKPCVLKDAPVSARTLRCIEKSIVSMKAGKRSPVDLKALAAMKL